MSRPSDRQRQLVRQLLSAYTPNKRLLRQQLIRNMMPLVKDGVDSQAIVHEFGNDQRFSVLLDGKTPDEQFNYLEQAVVFCEHACGFSR